MRNRPLIYGPLSELLESNADFKDVAALQFTKLLMEKFIENNLLSCRIEDSYSKKPNIGYKFNDRIWKSILAMPKREYDFGDGAYIRFQNYKPESPANVRPEWHSIDEVHIPLAGNFEMFYLTTLKELTQESFDNNKNTNFTEECVANLIERQVAGNTFLEPRIKKVSILGGLIIILHPSEEPAVLYIPANLVHASKMGMASGRSNKKIAIKYDPQMAKSPESFEPRIDEFILMLKQRAKPH